MAGYFMTFVIEWQCLKPEIYHEEHGYVECVGRSISEVSDAFLAVNPDYKIITVKFKDK